MEVKLLNHTPDPVKTVALAARLCYSDKKATELSQNMTSEQIDKLVKKLREMGHESPVEHVSFTFAIQGVSRTLSHQLVRHRIASYSQKSQRYVSETTFEYVIPPSIAGDERALEEYNQLMEQIRQTYKSLAEKVHREDARYILPNACETNLVATFNARSLYNFFKLRCCSRAQWEIRELAKKMLAEVRSAAGILFENAGAQCDIDGTCPEGDMSCGRYKKLLKQES